MNIAPQGNTISSIKPLETQAPSCQQTVTSAAIGRISQTLTGKRAMMGQLDHEPQLFNKKQRVYDQTIRGTRLAQFAATKNYGIASSNRGIELVDRENRNVLLAPTNTNSK